MTGPILTVDPTRGFGEVTVQGRTLRAEYVAFVVWDEDGDVDRVAADYEITREEALLCCWWCTTTTSGGFELRKDRDRYKLWRRWADEQVIQILGGHRKGVELCNPDDYTPEEAS